jgi:hypothetical protein
MKKMAAKIDTNTTTNSSDVIFSGGAFLVTPTTVEIFLVDPTAAAGTATTLSVAAGNGIVATDDGGTWAGVADLPLPFA